MKAIDIIIPIHKYNKEVKILLKDCLISVKEMAKNSINEIKVDVNIVGPHILDYSEEIFNLIEWSEEFESFNIVENNENATDFCTQVNFCVEKQCKNDYFMIVEFDDIVTPKWLNMASPYIKIRKKCPIFLPLVELYDIEKPSVPLQYINEIAWSSSFVENELGSLNVDALKEYCNFNVTGAIIKRHDFIKAGMFKPSIKLSFGYELLLRLAQFYGEVFVIPKVGYFHYTNREDSLTSEYHKTMTSEEGSWWIKLATEEYVYKKDRNKTYSVEEDEK